MTHPTVESVADTLFNSGHCHKISMADLEKISRQLVAEVLRLVRKPSAAMAEAVRENTGGIADNGGREREDFEDEWRAGIDALLREVEG